MKLATRSPVGASENREFAIFRLPLLPLGADQAGHFRFHQRRTKACRARSVRCNAFRRCWRKHEMRLK